VTTPTGVVTVGREQAPRITQSPEPITIAAVDTTPLAAEAWAVPAASVQWELRKPGSTVWETIAGATERTLDATGLSTGVQYRATFSNQIGGTTHSTVSATATVRSTAPAENPEPITPTSSNKGDGITASVTGSLITVSLGKQWNGAWIGSIIHSDPAFLGWRVVADGTVVVPVPSGMTGEHKVALHDANGEIIGWAAISIPVPSTETPDGETPQGQQQGAGPKALASTGLSIEGVLGLAALLFAAGAIVIVRRRMTRA
jgi:hypothetical protein